MKQVKVFVGNDCYGVGQDLENFINNNNFVILNVFGFYNSNTKYYITTLIYFIKPKKKKSLWENLLSFVNR